jgi:hypothetical protein
MLQITYFENYSRYTETFTREEAEREVIKYHPITAQSVKQLSDTALWELLNQVFNG